jgi:hypothetical protein
MNRGAQLPLGQDDARRALVPNPFWDTLWQPATVGEAPRGRCQNPTCSAEWSYAPPVKIWLMKFKDYLKRDTTLQGGFVDKLNTWFGDAYQKDISVRGWTGVKTWWATADLISHDTQLSNRSFYNPRAQFHHDSFLQDVSLAGGGLLLVVLTAPTVADEFALDATMQSGEYFLVVVTGDTIADEFSFEVTLASGAYDLKVVVAPGVADELTLDVTLLSGSYPLTVEQILTVQDSFSKDSTLVSGAYG